MSETLFESEFSPVSDKEWIEKIEKDLRGKSFDSLKWKLENGSVIEPFYSQSRDKSKDDAIHQRILQHLTSRDWKIIQDLRKANSDEIEKAFASDVDLVMASDNSVMTKSKGIEILIDDDSSLESTKTNNTDSEILIDASSSWLAGKVGNDNFTLLRSDISNVFINGSLFHNAGANDEYELALTLSLLNEQLHYIQSNSLNAKHFIIELGVGINFNLSVSKFRAMRILVQKLLSLYDIENTFELRGRTSEYWNAHKDQHTNLLRHTTMGLSAVIGEVDGLIVSPFEDASPLSFRLARNIQHLLKNESYLDKVKDMMAGSYLIEELTLNFMDQAWSEFKKLEDQGGFLKLSNEGVLRKEVDRQHQKRVEKLKNEEIIMIGVNKFNKEDEKAAKLNLPISNEAWVLNKRILSNEF